MLYCTQHWSPYRCVLTWPRSSDSASPYGRLVKGWTISMIYCEMFIPNGSMNKIHKWEPVILYVAVMFTVKHIICAIIGVYNPRFTLSCNSLFLWLAIGCDDSDTSFSKTCFRVCNNLRMKKNGKNNKLYLKYTAQCYVCCINVRYLAIPRTSHTHK